MTKKAKRTPTKDRAYTVDVSQYTGTGAIGCVYVAKKKPTKAEVEKATRTFLRTLSRKMKTGSLLTAGSKNTQ